MLIGYHLTRITKEVKRELSETKYEISLFKPSIKNVFTEDGQRLHEGSMELPTARVHAILLTGPMDPGHCSVSTRKSHLHFVSENQRQVSTCSATWAGGGVGVGVGGTLDQHLSEAITLDKMCVEGMLPYTCHTCLP